MTSELEAQMTSELEAQKEVKLHKPIFTLGSEYRLCSRLERRPKGEE